MRLLVIKVSLFACLLLTLPAVSAQDSLKILSLNAWTMPFVGKEIWTRTKIIGHNIHNYDFIGLQEIWLPWNRTWIRRYGPKFKTIFQKTPLGMVMGSGIFNLTRYKIVKSGFYRYQNCSGIDCYAAKGVLFNRIQLQSGQEIDIYNTHLNAGEKEAYNSRAKQLQQLKSYITYHDKGNPILVMGDFNVAYDSEEYKTVQQHMEGFIDAWPFVHPNDPGLTSDPARNKWIKDSAPSRIDYIFFRNGKDVNWKIEELKLAFDEPMGHPGMKNKMLASDHFGIQGVFTLESKKLNLANN